MGDTELQILHTKKSSSSSFSSASSSSSFSSSSSSSSSSSAPSSSSSSASSSSSSFSSSSSSSSENSSLERQDCEGADQSYNFISSPPTQLGVVLDHSEVSRMTLGVALDHREATGCVCHYISRHAETKPSVSRSLSFPDITVMGFTYRKADFTSFSSSSPSDGLLRCHETRQGTRLLGVLFIDFNAADVSTSGQRQTPQQSCRCL